MLIDMRVYQYHPNRFRPFLKYYHERGFAMTSRHLGETLGVYASESGVQNRTFQFFYYDDTAHRDVCRKNLLSDDEWSNFTKVAGEALIQQANTLLEPAAFSPFGGAAPDPAMRTGARRLFELRTYSFRPGARADALKIAETEWAPAVGKHVRGVIGYFLPVTGTTDQLLALWAFEGSPARFAQTAALVADPGFLASEARLDALVTHKEITLLLPTEDSPCR